MGLFDPDIHLLKKRSSSLWDGRATVVAWCGWTERADRAETLADGAGSWIDRCGRCERKARAAGQLS